MVQSELVSTVRCLLLEIGLQRAEQRKERERRIQMADEIEDIIGRFLANEILKEPDRKIQYDEALISSGLIDSFSLVDAALFVEDTFGVRIEDSELTASTFDTIAELAGIIRDRQG